LAVRARLEDLLDQIEARLTSLGATLGTYTFLFPVIFRTGVVVPSEAIHNASPLFKGLLPIAILVFTGEMEEWRKQRVELADWIAEQRAVVADWRSKPAKLRPESAQQELSAMNSLMNLITERRSKLLTELPSHGELLADEPNLEESLDELEEEVMYPFKRFEPEGAVYVNNELCLFL